MNSVFDANCWAKYLDEWMDNVPGVAMNAYNLAMSNGSIVFDDKDLIRQQYIDMKKPMSEELFKVWYSDKELHGKVKKYSSSMSGNSFFKELSALGVPSDEYVYFKIAKNSKSKYIVSEDVDFFDPSQKEAGSDKIKEIKEKSSGPVCKHMKRKHSILIKNLSNFTDEVEEVLLEEGGELGSTAPA